MFELEAKTVDRRTWRWARSAPRDVATLELAAHPLCIDVHDSP